MWHISNHFTFVQMNFGHCKIVPESACQSGRGSNCLSIYKNFSNNKIVGVTLGRPTFLIGTVIKAWNDNKLFECFDSRCILRHQEVNLFRRRPYRAAARGAFHAAHTHTQRPPSVWWHVDIHLASARQLPFLALRSKPTRRSDFIYSDPCHMRCLPAEG